MNIIKKSYECHLFWEFNLKKEEKQGANGAIFKYGAHTTDDDNLWPKCCNKIILIPLNRL